MVHYPNSPLRENTQMRKAVKVVDFHGFFVFSDTTQNVKKRKVSLQKRDPFFKNAKRVTRKRTSRTKSIYYAFASLNGLILL
jgi:hypothetical protein